jgi:hypothetical protein
MQYDSAYEKPKGNPVCPGLVLCGQSSSYSLHFGRLGIVASKYRIDPPLPSVSTPRTRAPGFIAQRALPHLAAERNGVVIDPAALCLPSVSGPLVVEGRVV